jgi:hypothetical protein
MTLLNGNPSPRDRWNAIPVSRNPFASVVFLLLLAYPSFALGSYPLQLIVFRILTRPTVDPISKHMICVEPGFFLHLLMLPLRDDSNNNYSFGYSQREPFCSRLVGPHTIFQNHLCQCDFQLSLTCTSFALGSYPLQLIVFVFLTGATVVPISKHVICVELGFFLHLLMLPLRYDSSDNYYYGYSQHEPFRSRLVGPHTIFRNHLCQCDFHLSLADPWLALGSYPFQLIVFEFHTGATIDPISKHMICVELGFFLHLLMLPLRYDSSDNYSFGYSQREPFCSRLVGPHTIFRNHLCRCNVLLSLADPSLTLGSFPLQLIVFAILTGVTIAHIRKHMICVELGFFLHLLMLPLRYDSNDNCSYGYPQPELFCSSLVGPHTISETPLLV